MASNPAEGMNVRLLCLLYVVSRTGHRDEPITGTEELYHARAPVCVCVCVCVCLIVCDLETSTVKWPRFDFCFSATQKKKQNVCTSNI